MDTGQAALALSALAIIATIGVGLLAWSANRKANTLNEESVTLTRRIEAIEQQRHAWEIQDRERAEQGSLVANFQVKLRNDAVLINNSGKYPAIDVSWILRDSSETDFSIPSEPTGTDQISVGQTWKFLYLAGMSHSDTFIVLKWTDGRGQEVISTEHHLRMNNWIEISG